MYIDNPAVVVSENSDDSFVVFGELKYGDIESMVKGAKANNNTTKPQEIKEEPEEEDDDGVELDKGDLKEEDIAELINYSQCSRNKAIRVLKKSNGDLVEALSKLS
jgi:NACalpha-BTF3-like transcription factor